MQVENHLAVILGLAGMLYIHELKFRDVLMEDMFQELFDKTLVLLFAEQFQNLSLRMEFTCFLWPLKRIVLCVYTS